MDGRDLRTLLGDHAGLETHLWRRYGDDRSGRLLVALLAEIHAPVARGDVPCVEALVACDLRVALAELRAVPDGVVAYVEACRRDVGQQVGLHRFVDDTGRVHAGGEGAVALLLETAAALIALIHCVDVVRQLQNDLRGAVQVDCVGEHVVDRVERSDGGETAARRGQGGDDASHGEACADDRIEQGVIFLLSEQLQQAFARRDLVADRPLAGVGIVMALVIVLIDTGVFQLAFQLLILGYGGDVVVCIVGDLVKVKRAAEQRSADLADAGELVEGFFHAGVRIEPFRLDPRFLEREVFRSLRQRVEGEACRSQAGVIDRLFLRVDGQRGAAVIAVFVPAAVVRRRIAEGEGIAVCVRRGDGEAVVRQGVGVVGNAGVIVDAEVFKEVVRVVIVAPVAVAAEQVEHRVQRVRRCLLILQGGVLHVGRKLVKAGNVRDRAVVEDAVGVTGG